MKNEYNCLAVRKALKKHQSFLKALCDGDQKRKLLRRATELQLVLVAQIIFLVLNKRIAIKREKFDEILKKKKFKSLITTFQDREDLEKFERLDKEEQLTTILKFTSVIHQLLYCLFNK